MTENICWCLFFNSCSDGESEGETGEATDEAAAVPGRLAALAARQPDHGPGTRPRRRLAGQGKPQLRPGEGRGGEGEMGERHRGWRLALRGSRGGCGTSVRLRGRGKGGEAAAVRTQQLLLGQLFLGRFYSFCWHYDTVVKTGDHIKVNCS